MDQVIASRDGYIRRVVIKYYNAGDDQPQFTDRAARKMVKLWSLDESCLFDDLGELQQRIDGNADTAATDDLPGAGLGAAEVCARLTSPDAEESQPHGASVSYVRGHLAAPSCSPLLASIAGYSDRRIFVGPSYVTLDGDQLDLASWSISCDLAPLHVHLAD